MTDPVVDAITALIPELKPEHQAGLAPAIAGASAQGSSSGSVAAAAVVPITIDARVQRMIRLAILSAPAVILVGPPGTGKTTLLRQVVDEIRADPDAFGFGRQLNEPIWSTPQENWTTTDLVGGDTIDGGEVRFRPGLVLQAIETDRWLILDEVNRADMDRIFGGLLTWLSGQGVTVGQVSPAVGSPSVELGWSDSWPSAVEGTEQLTNPTPAGPTVRYMAGSDWRLLGTYNALDAQRVFRFGQAIGRRFLRVPIPAPSPAEFRQALDSHASDISEPLRTAIGDLYEAHRADPETELGPALFLRIPDYLRAGLGTGAESISSGNGEGTASAPSNAPASDAGAAGSAGDTAGQPSQAIGVDAVERELLAEAYLINVGTWLRQMDDALVQLRERVVMEHGSFSGEEWDWVVESSRVLA